MGWTIDPPPEQPDIGVTRQQQSLGEIYFPLGVAALFLLSGGDPLRYTIPLLLLTLADAVAALIGVRFGRTRYTTAEGHKSAEGSLAFFGAAFLSVLLSLRLLGHHTAPAEMLLISLILALLMMLVEAVAWRGLDNLLVPVAGFWLLDRLLTMAPAELLAQLALTLGLSLFVLLWRRYANLQDTALLGAALVGYLSWTLADWRWFVGPLLLFAGHVLLASGGLSQKRQPASSRHSFPVYNIYAVLSVAAGGLLWLLLARLLHRPELFYPFTLALAVQLALFGLVTYKHSGRSLSLRLVLKSSLFGWLLLFATFVLLAGVSAQTLVGVLLALPVVWLATFIFYQSQPVRNNQYPTDSGRWLRQTGCALLGSLVGLGPLYLL